jgi:Kef-type K+ transport system membrane component KefB
MALRGWTRRLNIDATSLEHKFDAVGYGIFIPIFFISSGMTLDLKAISGDPLRLLIIFALLLIVRGLPSLLIYRCALPPRRRAEMTFITATTLPLLIALADIGQQDGVMLPATAAAMIGSGVLSVLVYPSSLWACTGQHRRPPPTSRLRRQPPPGPTPRRITPASLSQIASAQSRLPISIASWGADR